MLYLDFLISIPSTNITWEIIQNHPDKNWDWEWISENPNITWEIIQNNPDKKWNWELISENTMKKGKQKWIEDKRIQIIKALQISGIGEITVVIHNMHWHND